MPAPVSWLRAFAACVLLTGGVRAAEPTLEPLQADTADVLKIIGATAWKWTHRPAAPYTKIEVWLVHYTRQSSGEFKREALWGSTHTFQEPHVSDEIFASCINQDGHPAFLIDCGGSASGPKAQPGMKWGDFHRLGGGAGGLPWMIGQEYVLIARYSGDEINHRKEDLLEYVSVEVETK